MNIFLEKTAIVTGGASGIGRALGEELARRGACVVLADMNEKLLAETVNSIKRTGNCAKGVRLDVTDVEAFKRVVDETVSEHGRLDYIFNNAGTAVGGEVKDFSYADWRSVIDVNLYGVVNGVFAAYPVMIKQGFGHIINTGSVAGLIPAPGEVSYTASKHGVVGLSNALRVEAADFGVKVSVACPSFIKTPMLDTVKLIGVDRKKLINDLIPRQISADSCARLILGGVERNKATIAVGRMAKFLWRLQRISPVLMSWMLMRDVRRMRKEIHAG